MSRSRRRTQKDRRIRAARWREGALGGHGQISKCFACDRIDEVDFVVYCAGSLDWLVTLEPIPSCGRDVGIAGVEKGRTGSRKSKRKGLILS
jgi:hypothetical protein